MSDYAQTVIEFIERRGWETSATTVREGVSLVLGTRERPDGTASILTLVVEDPEPRVSPDHVRYLLDAGQSRNVDNVLLTATVPFSDAAKQATEASAVDRLDPERVSEAGRDGGAVTNRLPLVGSGGPGSSRSGRTLLTRRRLLLGSAILGGLLWAGRKAGPDGTGSDTPTPSQTDTQTETPPHASTPTPTLTPTPTPTFRGERYSTVFLGNSYTANNSLPGVYQSALRHTATYDRRPLTTQSVTAGGRRLHQHVDGLDSGGEVASVLDGDDTSWDSVVLQEQSQIPGFSPGHPERERSIESAVRLAEAASATGARTILFLTWGRRTGDEMNPELYPDFETMQRRLADGYRAMASRIESAGHPVAVAPVGLAFRAVYDTVAASDTDPATEGTAFWELYADDGSHPSPQGTYLAALVIAGTATDISPSAVSYTPDSIGQSRASRLRTAASDALDSWSR